MPDLGEAQAYHRVDLPPAILGEGPVWDARHDALVWVDLHGKQVRRYRPSTGREDVLDTPSMAGAIAPRTQGGYIVTLEDGFWTLDDSFASLTLALPLPSQRSAMWMNDARCDPLGRLWAGVVSATSTPGGGALYRLDTDWRLTCIVDGIILSNGLGWSPDGQTMYHVDSRRGTIFKSDFEMATGVPSNRHPLILIPDAEGSPDGLSIDHEGCIWLAIWDGYVLRRYAPNATILSEIRLPPRRVSSCAFGGKDARDIYITTARAEIPPEEAERTFAGHIFAARSHVAGMPVAAFGG